MVKTIRPHGSVREDHVTAITEERPGRFALIDDCGNIYGIDEEVFNALKCREYKEIKLYEIRKNHY